MHSPKTEKHLSCFFSSERVKSDQICLYGYLIYKINRKVSLMLFWNCFVGFKFSWFRFCHFVVANHFLSLQKLLRLYRQIHNFHERCGHRVHAWAFTTEDIEQWYHKLFRDSTCEISSQPTFVGTLSSPYKLT